MTAAREGVLIPTAVSAPAPEQRPQRRRPEDTAESGPLLRAKTGIAIPPGSVTAQLAFRPFTSEGVLAGRLPEVRRPLPQQEPRRLLHGYGAAKLERCAQQYARRQLQNAFSLLRVNGPPKRQVIGGLAIGAILRDVVRRHFRTLRGRCMRKKATRAPISLRTMLGVEIPRLIGESIDTLPIASDLAVALRHTAGISIDHTLERRVMHQTAFAFHQWKGSVHI